MVFVAATGLGEQCAVIGFVAVFMFSTDLGGRLPLLSVHLVFYYAQ